MVERPDMVMCMDHCGPQSARRTHYASVAVRSDRVNDRGPLYEPMYYDRWLVPCYECLICGHKWMSNDSRNRDWMAEQSRTLTR